MASVHMVPDRVRRMAKGFDTASDILKAVSAVLEVQMMILKTTAFMGLVGGLVVERYLNMIKPQIDQLARKFEEMSQDIEKAVRLWEQTSQAG